MAASSMAFVYGRSRAARVAVLSLGGGLVTVLALMAANELLGLGSGVVFDELLGLLAGTLAVAACALRALLVREDRLAWAIIATALSLNVAGEMTWAFWFEGLDDAPVPSIVDLMWLTAYPAGYLAMTLLLRLRAYRFGLSAWLDGVIASLVVAAVMVVAIQGAVSDAIEGESGSSVAASLAYPVADLLLLGFVVGAFALSGWRPSGQWLLLGGGFAALAASDMAHLGPIGSGDYAIDGLAGLGWAAGVTLIAFAAWQRPEVVDSRLASWPTLAVPALLSVAATGLLVMDHFQPVTLTATLLAAGALVAGVARTGLAFRDARHLTESRREALTDDLTGLANRRHFFLRLESELADTQRRLGVLVLDLDDFKELNDTLGHHAGDLLLCEVARRLTSGVRAQDVLARLGGDEFAVLVMDADAQQAQAAAARIRAAIGRPYELEGIRLAVDASVGIALFPQSATTAQGLVQRADVAMYQAKAGRTGSELYASERDARSRERLALSGELRRAIGNDELVLHYQPICDPRTGHAPAAEALVRWEHPDRGLLMPGAFLDLAARAGAMRELTLWVVNAAAAQAREWRDLRLPVRVSVNLSPQNLLDLRLPDDVAAILDSVGVASDALTFEITEETIMADPLRAKDILFELHELGVGLALDDFGTGWSSLGHLRRMPVEVLKIDRSFVTRMTEDHDDAVIVRSTIELARNLRLGVVAEGVENLATWAALTQMGCDLIQGFGVSRPLPTAQATQWLAAHNGAMRSPA